MLREVRWSLNLCNLKLFPRHHVGRLCDLNPGHQDLTSTLPQTPAARARQRGHVIVKHLCCVSCKGVKFPERRACWWVLESICIHAYIYIYIYVCVCIHAYMHTCIHAYMHTCIHAYMHTYIHKYIHTYINTYTYTNTCLHTHDIDINTHA